MNRHGLRDDQYARMEEMLPGRPGYVGRDSELGNKLFVEAVIWKFRRSLARHARAVRGLEEHSHPFLALGDQRDLGESFQSDGG